MVTFRIKSVVSVLMVTVLFSGCSRNRELLKSFEDVSSGHTRQGQFKISQYKTMSINGQMPFTDIGSAFYYRPGRGNLASVGVLWNDDPLHTHRDSYELVQTYAPTAKKEKIQELRDTLLKLTGAVADVVVQIRVFETAESKLNAAQEKLAEASQQLETEQSALRKAEDAVEALKLKISLEERNQAVLEEKRFQKQQEWESLKGELDTLLDGAQRLASKEKVDLLVEEMAEFKDLASESIRKQADWVRRLSGLESAASSASHVVNAADHLKEAAQAQFEIHKKIYDEAEENLMEARSASQTYEQLAVQLVKEENLFLFRWNADKSTLGSLKITENLFGNYEKNLGRSGFVIMSGMRSRKLFLSEDDAAKLERNTHDNHYAEIKPFRYVQWLLPFHHGNSLHIVTHLVETHNEAYVSEQSLRKAADVKLDGKAFTGMEFNADVLSEATLQAARSALENLANLGTISAPEISRKPVLWPWSSPESLGAYTAYKDAWIPVMAVTTRLSDLDDIFKNKRLSVRSESSIARNLPALSLSEDQVQP